MAGLPWEEMHCVNGVVQGWIDSLSMGLYDARRSCADAFWQLRGQGNEFEPEDVIALLEKVGDVLLAGFARAAGP